MKFFNSIYLFYFLYCLSCNLMAQGFSWSCKGDLYFPDLGGSPIDSPNSAFHIDVGGDDCNRDQFDFLNGSHITWENIYSSDWALIINDEFTGNKINSNLWYDYSFGNTTPHNNSIAAVISDNSQVNNGHLIQIGNYDTDPNKTYLVSSDWDPPIPPHYEHYDYTQPEIDSKFILTPPVWVQIKCKIIPDANHNWPAFWMYGAAKNGYEIDGFEITNDPGATYDDSDPAAFMKMTYHGAKYGNVAANGKSIGFASDYYTGVDLNQDFHTYDIIWDNYRIEWRLDGSTILKQHKYFDVDNFIGDVDDNDDFRTTAVDKYEDVQVPHRYAVNKYFPDKSQPMGVILGFAIRAAGGSYEGVEMQTDYVKVWKSSPCHNDITIPSLNFQFIDAGNGRGFTSCSGLTVSTLPGSTNMIIPANYIGNFTAIDEIALQDGFGVDNGGYFEAFNTTCIPLTHQREQNTNAVGGTQTTLPSSNGFIPNISLPENSFVHLTKNTDGYKIESVADKINSIELYDLSGNLVYQAQQIYSYQFDLSRKSFAAGIYTMRIFSEQDVFIKKIFIE